MTELRICFVGDSLTHGTRDGTTLGWPGRLCAKAVAGGHDVTLYNLGIRRDTSADIARRWPALWISPAPIGRKHNPACALWALEADYQDQRAAQLTQDYAHIAAELQVPFLDIFTPLARSRAYRAALAEGGDETHPAARGYAAIARLIERWPAWQAWFR